MNQLQNAVDQLTQKVEDFHQMQEEKLAAIQKKYASPELFERRPASSLDIQKDDEGFRDFLRKGEGRFLKKALSASSDENGGHLVPEYLYEKILNELTSLSPIRSLARVMSVSTSAADVLLNKKDPEVGWTGETDERRETTTPELFKLSIPVHEIFARPRATQKLLDDAKIDVENWLVARIGSQMALTETRAFINGDGNNKPKGFLVHPTTENPDDEWRKIQMIKTGVDGDFPEGKAAEVLIDTMHAMASEYLDGAVWFLSRSALAAIRKLKDPHTGHFLWQPSLGQVSASLLGHPVIVCDEMPQLKVGTSSKPIAFINFKAAYQIVDRGQMHILRDPYSAKPYVEFYTTKRVGGDVVNTRAIKLIQFAK